MSHQSNASHVERTAGFLQRLKGWAEPREDVRALVIVGSVARGDPRPDSDVDVLLLASHPEWYLNRTDWVSSFGGTQSVEIEEYGEVVSVRAVYSDSLEVESAVAGADWASAPIDAGAEGVARNGILVLLDRDGQATALAQLSSVRAAFEVLADHPLLGRVAEDGRRELVLSRGKYGYLAKCRWLPAEDVVLILAVRHQHEAGYTEDQ